MRRIPKDRRKIFAWGGFSIKGKTSVFCFRNIMDAPFYVSILQKHIGNNGGSSKITTLNILLKNNVPQVMDWPSNSPDLNPIENLWSIVKRNVEKRMPRNLEDLERMMVEEWNNIPDETIINLVKSMKNRCQLVIKNNGERIDY